MKKIFSARKIILTVTTGFCIVAGAQDKTIELKFKEKHRYTSHDFTENGMTFLTTVNDKSSKVDLNVLSFDSDFNANFSKNLESKYKGLPAFFGRGMSDRQVYYSMLPTLNGLYAISFTDEQIFDAKGNARKFDIDKLDDSEKFDTKFRVYNDKYACFFGYKKEDNKKNKVSDETYFYKVNLDDLSKNLIEIKFPAFPTIIKGEKIKKKGDETKDTWEIASHDNNQFLMINKRWSEDHTEDQYNIVSFDYDGKVLSTMSIPLQLKNKYFALSDTGFGSKTFIQSDMVGVGLMSGSATGNIYVEDNKEFFYIYGLYSNNKISNINKVEYNGFYINKFNAKGELIWKTEKAIVDKDGLNKTQRPIAVTVDFVLLKDNKIGLSMSSFFEKYMQMSLVDSQDGKILKNQKQEIKIEGNRLEGISGSAFPTGYALDDIYQKKHMDRWAVFAGFLNPKVDKFLKTASKIDLNYNCKITPNGIYMIEENYKDKTFKLLKFDF
ncbi:hypothetical protein [Flavobacterium sp.]|uniref:hypothetical protein n=1 Tax=Flavobacterium sp. TaxID=239 RepID=UPI00262F8CA8|nr:hypothetical protein [Flavobacterium sp.]